MAKGKSTSRSVKVPMTQERASAIQRATALKAGAVTKESFASAACSAAAKNINDGLVPAPAKFK